MKKIVLTLVVLGLFILETQAQNSLYSIQYSMGFGAGDMGSYISQPSFRGATFEYRRLVNPNVGVGLELGWNVFYERKAYGSYTLDNATLSGVQFRTVNNVPIYASVDYYFKPGEKINPFIGLGVGTLYTERATDMGIYRLLQDTWQFGLRPEVGLRYEMSESTDAILALKYHNGFSNDTLTGQSFFAVNVGFVFKH